MNQGPGNVTKRSCTGELTTKRLEDRESEGDPLVSQNVSLMFHSRMSSILPAGCYSAFKSTLGKYKHISCKYNSGFNFPYELPETVEWLQRLQAVLTNFCISRCQVGENSDHRVFPYVRLVIITSPT